MKRVCLLCERSSPDLNLYCQETYCPAESSPIILEEGEWFGDIEIVRPVMILRSATLYEAVHQRQRVFMKVAHPGTEHRDRMKRESDFLKRLQGSNAEQPYLPSLMPPYAYTTVDRDAYGKTMLQGHLLYFYLFKHLDAQPLRDLLAKNAQLWINHVGWLMTQVATAVNYLHINGIFCYGLSPETVLVHQDPKTGIPRIVLYDFGIAATKAELGSVWQRSFLSPAYTAPELLVDHGSVPYADYRTDVYGLGSMLYELLVGQPMYTYKLRSEADVQKAVLSNLPVPMNRMEDVEKVAKLALAATQPQLEQRPMTAADLATQLKEIFGEPPEERERKPPRGVTILVAAAALIAIAFLFVLAVSLARLVG